MSGGSKYKTKQKAQILSFLESARGEHLTAKDVQKRLEDQNVQMGTATVYRQLESLVSEGLVRKYNLGPGNGACFEFVGEDPCENEHCFHCMCTECGKLTHVECGHLASVGDHMMDHHGFTLDPLRTVFYGTCSACAAKDEKEN